MSSKYLTDYLEANAQKWPNQPAIVFEDESMTWRELWESVNQVAAALEPFLDSTKQQIVGLLMPNCTEYVVTNLAIVHLGHIALPIDVIYKSIEIDAVIHQMKPAVVITDDLNLPRIISHESKVISFNKLPQAGSRPKKLLRINPTEQVASLLFTSGTTGRPKAAPYTHSNHIWNIKVCSQAWKWNHRDSLLISLRLTHWYGLVMGLTGTLIHGNTLYLQEKFDAVNTLKVLASGKITMFTHGPVAFTRLVHEHSAANYDLSKVRLFISGSAPLPPRIWHKFRELFNAEILEVYGSSETGRITSNLLDERMPGSPGRILPGVEVKFSTHGEVLVRSPGVFPGYFNNPAATKTATAPGGWWKTGDLAKLENGRLILKGRLSERIRRFGYVVSPRDVEWVLHKFPKIKESFVLGVQRSKSPDDKLIYFLVGECSEEEVREFCKQNMPSIWRPDKIIFLEHIPRNRSGKAHLAELRTMVD